MYHPGNHWFESRRCQVRMIQIPKLRAGHFDTFESFGLDHMVIRFRGGEVHSVQDTLAIEEPLEIRLRHGKNGGRQTMSLSVTMRTPGDDFALAAGFLAAEGVIRERSDVLSIDWVVGQRSADMAVRRGSVLPIYSGKMHRNILQATLHPDVVVNLAPVERSIYTTPSCGVRGKASSILALRTVCPL